jgi:DNA topoisomerase-1
MLIKQLEKDGIGRPSTYSSIIQNLIDKNYVIQGDIPTKEYIMKQYLVNKKYEKIENDKKINLGGEKNKMLIQPIAIRIVDFLINNFNDLFDIQYTAKMEKSLDKIALGKINKKEFLQDFYSQIKPIIDKYNQPNKIINFRNNEQEFIITKSKFGDVIKDNNNKYYPIKPFTKEELNNDIINLLISLPKEITTKDDKPIILNNGKFGFYLTWDNLKISIDKNDILKSNKEFKNLIKNQLGIKLKINEKILYLKKGKYGYYLKYNDKNLSLPDFPYQNTPKTQIIQMINDLYKF